MKELFFTQDFQFIFRIFLIIAMIIVCFHIDSNKPQKPKNRWKPWGKRKFQMNLSDDLLKKLEIESSLEAKEKTDYGLSDEFKYKSHYFLVWDKLLEMLFLTDTKVGAKGIAFVGGKKMNGTIVSIKKLCDIVPTYKPLFGHPSHSKLERLVIKSIVASDIPYSYISVIVTNMELSLIYFKTEEEVL